MKKRSIPAILIPLAFVACSSKPPAVVAPSLAAGTVGEPVELPGAADGINFDDLGFSPSLSRVIVPAGRTGKLILIDPKTNAITSVGGFSSALTFDEARGIGTTSADSAPGVLLATDRGRKTLAVVDAEKKVIVSETPLAAGPDYVRVVASRREAWVTEPAAKQIEVFSLGSAEIAVPHRVAVIVVPGGPESLVIDPARDRAWTHLWSGTTVGISLSTRALVERWPNGCRGSRGIALDGAFVLAGCDEGRAVVLGSKGEAVSSYSDGAGVDIIAIDLARRVLFLPGGDSATMAVLGVGAKGALTFMGRVETARDAHCVTTDNLGNAWVCDPSHGRLLKYAPPTYGLK